MTLAIGTSDRLTIESDKDMFDDPTCFARIIEREKPDYVIHTAAPFFEETR